MQHLGFVIENPNAAVQEGQQAVGELEKLKSPVPPGEYVIQLRKWDSSAQFFKRSNANGIMVKMVFEIVGGEHDGRKLFKDVCAMHGGSAKAQSIGQAEIAAIMQACGSTRNDSLDPCLNRPIKAIIDIEPERVVNGHTYQARNEIKPLSYAPSTPAQAPAPSYAQSAPAPQQAAAPAAPAPAPAAPAVQQAPPPPAAQAQGAQGNMPAWMKQAQAST